MKVTIAKTYGFCQGVRRAIDIAKNAASSHPDEPIYMLNKIVHNRAVVDDLSSLGIVTLEGPASPKEKLRALNGGIVIFSAHGHDPEEERIARERKLKIIDATCPLVKKNLDSIRLALKKQKKIFYIGIPHHPETEAALALDASVSLIDFHHPVVPECDEGEISVHNQTTLIREELQSIHDKIKARYADVSIEDDICFATESRQNSLRDIRDEDVIFIVGDTISSNSTRLYELAKKNNPEKAVFQVSGLEDVKKIDLRNFKKAFLAAGASTPDQAIVPIIAYLESFRP